MGDVEFLKEEKHTQDHIRNLSEAKKLQVQAIKMSVSKVVDLSKATKGSMSPSEQLNNMQIQKDEINDKITNILLKLQNKSTKTKHAPKSQLVGKLHLKNYENLKIGSDKLHFTQDQFSRLNNMVSLTL